MLLIIYSSPNNLLEFIVSIISLTIYFIPVISFLLLRASAYLLSLLGVYIILNLNLPSLSNYLAYYCVSTLDVVKYIKFL